MLGGGPLPNWLCKKRCIYAVDNAKGNLCIWPCLVIANWVRNDQARPVEDTTRDALKLAHECYSSLKLRVNDIIPTKLVDFKNIASRFQVNIRLYESVNQLAWRLVFGEALDSSIASSIANKIDIGNYEGHCFYIKELDILANH